MHRRRNVEGWSEQDCKVRFLCVGCLRENSCKWPQRGDQPTFRVLKLPVQKGISDERLFLVFELQDKHGVTCSVVEICGLVLPVTNC